MRLPDFIVIGAAKAGTTALYDHLARRGDIYLSTPKEPEFFARDDRHAAGLEAYARLFEGARPDQICGEASTIYTLSPHFPKTASRVAAAVSGAKLIYIMREPVARAYSFYGQLVKNYQNATLDRVVHRNFEDFLDPSRLRAPRTKMFAPFDAHYPDDPGIILHGSDYPMQIRRWLEYYPREQMLFLLFEEFTKDPAAVLRRFYEFIGAPPDPEDGQPPLATNVAAAHFDRVRRDRFAAELTAKVPLLGQLSRRLPPRLRSAFREQAFRLLDRSGGAEGGTASVEPPKMRSETRAMLEARYEVQRAELAELTGLDLDRWWPRRGGLK